jgi:hypothetical protein
MRTHATAKVDARPHCRNVHCAAVLKQALGRKDAWYCQMSRQTLFGGCHNIWLLVGNSAQRRGCRYWNVLALFSLRKQGGVSPGIRAIRLWVLPNIPQVEKLLFDNVTSQCHLSFGMAEPDAIERPFTLSDQLPNTIRDVAEMIRFGQEPAPRWECARRWAAPSGPDHYTQPGKEIAACATGQL